MLLTVDIGNTQTAMGLFEDEELVAHWVFTTRVQDTADELQFLLAGQFELKGIDPASCDDVVIASVVPVLTECWATVGRRMTGRDPVIVGPGIKTGLAMQYDNPAVIGADRVADAMAAIKLEGVPVVVVDLGTTTNIEVIDERGRFRGGIIAPGMGTGADAMFSHAARLPQVDIVEPGHVIGTNTVDAMRVGAVYGAASLVDGMVERFAEALGETPYVVLTGELAPLVTPYLRIPFEYDESLVLDGLHLIWKKNRG